MRRRTQSARRPQSDCSWRSLRSLRFLLFVIAAPARSGAVESARFSLESVFAVDEFAGENASNRPQIVIDVSLAVRLGDHWQVLRAAVVPPAAAQLADRAGARLGHASCTRRACATNAAAPIATRVDVGYILSPIGLGLYDVRPGVNPTIVPHLSYLHADAGVRPDRSRACRRSPPPIRSARR